MQRPRSARWSAVVAASALLMAACSDDTPAPTEPDDSTTTITTTTAGAAPETTTTAAPADTETETTTAPTAAPATVEPPGEFDAVIVLEFADGDLVGGSRQVDVGIGDRVQMTAVGEIGDEIHVHGYDLHLRDGDDALEFDAVIPGTFEVELEGSGRLLLRMTVS